MTAQPYRRIRIDADPRVLIGHVLELLGFRRSSGDQRMSLAAWSGLLVGLTVILASIWFFRHSTTLILVGVVTGVVIGTVSILIVYRVRGWWYRGHGVRLGVAWEFTEGIARLAVLDDRGPVTVEEFDDVAEPPPESPEPPPRPSLYPRIIPPLATAAGTILGRDLTSFLPERRTSILRGLVILTSVLELLEERGFGEFRQGRNLGQAGAMLGLFGVALQALGAISGHWGAALLLGAALVAAPLALRLARGHAIVCTAGEVRLELSDRVSGDFYTLHAKGPAGEEEIEIAVDAVLAGGLEVVHPARLDRWAGDLFDRITGSGPD
jgi:hypothetical protein